MRTSRIAQHTSKVVQSEAKDDHTSLTFATTRRQTRSLALGLSKYAATSATTSSRSSVKKEIEDDDTAQSDGSSPITSLSGSADSGATAPKTLSRSSLKRKRGEAKALIAGSGKKAPARQRRPAKKVLGEDGQVEIHPPLHWEEVYATVRKMRAKLVAPVDTMGCETLAQDGVSPKVRRVHW